MNALQEMWELGNVVWESDTGIWVEGSESYRGTLYTVWVDGEDDSICESYHNEKDSAIERAKELDKARPNRYNVLELYDSLNKFLNMMS